MASAMKYFPHYINAQRDVKIIKLKRAHRMEGYGIYWALLEMIYESPKRAIECDYETVAALLDCDSQILKSVVEDFGLFAVDAGQGVFYSETARRYSDEYDASIEEKKEMRRERSRKAAAARWGEKKEKAKNKPKTEVKSDASLPGNNIASERETVASDRESPLNEPSSSTEDDGEYFSPDTDLSTVAPELNKLIEIWNETFAGTRRLYRGFTLDSISQYRARETLNAGYSIEDFKAAFEAARNDDFSWTLPTAVKVGNIQLLLAKGDKQNATRGNEAELSTTGDAGVFGVDWSQFERG